MSPLSTSPCLFHQEEMLEICLMHPNWREVQAEQVEYTGHTKPKGNLYFWQTNLEIQLNKRIS